MISPSFGKALVFSGQLILWIAFKEAITLITLAVLAVLTVIYALFIIGHSVHLLACSMPLLHLRDRQTVRTYPGTLENTSQDVQR